MKYLFPLIFKSFFWIVFAIVYAFVWIGLVIWNFKIPYGLWEEMLDFVDEEVDSDEAKMLLGAIFIGIVTFIICVCSWPLWRLTRIRWCL